MQFLRIPLIVVVLVLSVGCLGGSAGAAETVAASDSIEIADAQVSLIQNAFVAAPIAAVVAELTVAEGESVAVGDPLVRFDEELVRTEWDAAQAAYQAARMEADNDVNARYARRTRDVRRRELEQSVEANRQFAGAVSKTEISKLELVVDQAELAIEQAEHELRVAAARAIEKRAAAQIVEARLRHHTVAAPVAGLVVEVATQPGEWVEAGKPIVRLISLDPIRVECFVDGRLHGPELVGRPVQFFLSSSTAAVSPPADLQPLSGEVTFVSPELQPVTGQARVWATISNPNLIARPGMRGRVVIQGR